MRDPTSILPKGRSARLMEADTEGLWQMQREQWGGPLVIQTRNDLDLSSTKWYKKWSGSGFAL